MRALAATLGLGGLYAAAAQAPPPLHPFDASWIATDSEGRTLPTAAEVGPPNGKIVGVFYWLWHGFIRTNPIRDVQAELVNHPDDPQYTYQDWFHGQPEAGYYHAGDPWVARRSLQMLANAGVDFIFLDWTNGPIPSDPQVLYSFLDVAESMKAAGIPVPRFCFFLNADATNTFDWVNNNVYSLGKYQDLWFQWDGKPLLLSGDPLGDRQQQLQAFTVRPMWAFGDQTEDYWRFIDPYPQRPSTHGGVVEQICVGKAKGAPELPPGVVNDDGATFHDGQAPPYNGLWVSPDTPKGLYFEEQWRRALEVNPPLITVTGWNEWTAGAWHPDPGMVGSWTFAGKVMTEDSYRFVDEWNAEFNRDIEPMVGGYSDSYYYQLVANVRRYKGLPPTPGASVPRTMHIDGVFGEWHTVRPIYRDPAGDTAHRSFQNTDGSATLVDDAGRNDIVESLMAHDHDTLYAYAKTNEDLTAPAPGSWMALYLDVDGDQTTGWHGYEFVTQYTGTMGQMQVLRFQGTHCQFKKGSNCIGDDLKRIDLAFSEHQCCDLCKSEPGCQAWTWDKGSTMACYLKTACSNPIQAAAISGRCSTDEWSPVGTATFAYGGKKLEMALPKALLGLGAAPRVNFKWRDNNAQISALAELLSSGAEAAPDRRFAFSYVGRPAALNATAWI